MRAYSLIGFISFLVSVPQSPDFPLLRDCWSLRALSRHLPHGLVQAQGWRVPLAPDRQGMSHHSLIKIICCVLTVLLQYMFNSLYSLHLFFVTL